MLLQHHKSEIPNLAKTKDLGVSDISETETWPKYPNYQTVSEFRLSIIHPKLRK